MPLNDHMAEVGLEDSREEALAYVRACGGELADDDVAVALVDNAAPMLRFLEQRARCAFVPYPSTGPTHAPRRCSSPRSRTGP